MAVRRLLTIPAYIGLTLLVTAALPALLPAAAVLTMLPAFRGAVPTLLFVTAYLWCETIGIIVAFWIWIRHRDPARFLAANVRLQYWWANALKVVAETLFRLRFDVGGAEALEGPGALVLPRHASIADTIIPMVFYAIPRRIRLRYVLKRELLLDPCLDIVGNRLPNLFVDRGGQDSDRAREGVARLAADLEEDEGILIYAEGTRFSASKHAALLARYADSPPMLTQLRRWDELLPPRLGGTLALLQANPGRDLLFCAHTGFEGSSRFRDLLNGAWIGARIRIAFWRVPWAAIPKRRDEQVEFLFEQWDQMQQEVRRLMSAGAAAHRP
jgi:1-acyl-sn-glycerol-3-phosphate acyltransferase